MNIEALVNAISDSISGYFDRARQRAKRRKKPWNLLLIPAFLLTIISGVVLSILMVNKIHLTLFPGQSLKNSDGLGPILSVTAPLFGIIPLGFIIANFIFWCIPPARRTFEKEAEGHDGASFWKAQITLLKFAAVVVPLSLAISTCGILMSWTAR